MKTSVTCGVELSGTGRDAAEVNAAVARVCDAIACQNPIWPTVRLRAYARGRLLGVSATAEVPC